jgi:hypothetical protein
MNTDAIILNKIIANKFDNMVKLVACPRSKYGST